MELDYDFKKTFFNTHIQLILKEKEINDNEILEGELDKLIRELEIEQQNLKEKLNLMTQNSENTDVKNSPVTIDKIESNEKKYGIDVRRLFVKHLNPNTTVETLEKYFSEYGKVEDVLLLADKNDPNKNRTYAFITFGSLKKSPLHLQHYIDERLVSLRKLKPSIGTCETRYLLVSGVLNNLNNKDLSNYFSKYGKILKILKKNQKAKNQKIRNAYIEFASEESVEKIIKQPVHEINYHIVDVRKCQESEIKGDY